MADSTLHTLSLSPPIARALAVRAHLTPRALERGVRAPCITLPAHDRASSTPHPVWSTLPWKGLVCVTHPPLSLALAARRASFSLPVCLVSHPGARGLDLLRAEGKKGWGGGHRWARGRVAGGKAPERCADMVPWQSQAQAQGARLPKKGPSQSAKAVDAWWGTGSDGTTSSSAWGVIWDGINACGGGCQNPPQTRQARPNACAAT